jgi:diguanylate cyclase (GGDEF)-like protein
LERPAAATDPARPSSDDEVDRRTRAEAREREPGILGRVNAAEAQARAAARRDDQAGRRDIAAAQRDRVSETRDHEIATVEKLVSPGGPVLEGLRSQLQGLLAEAASDRADAAGDRRLAARDRARAAEDRAAALTALRGAHIDDLTGALRRGFGEDRLRAEMERAQRSGRPLMLAVADVDGLKDVNDGRGHLAGDELLKDLVAAIRANIRSYEPIVRLGGDEFAFVIGGIDRADAARRCDLIGANLACRPSSGRITVGIGELRTGDDLQDLVERADSALVETRRTRNGSGALRR